MTLESDNQMNAQLAQVDEMQGAGQAGAQLIELWPLTDATQLDNDAKYGENLQVRLTRALARLMTGLDVTIPDAEFVYEGADEIPGRPQEIVEALLAANDAYDGLAGFSRTVDFDQVQQAVERLEAGWSEAESQQAQQVVEAALATWCPQEVEASVDPAIIAQRLAASIQLGAALGQAVGAGPERVRAALPILLVVNEFNERLEIPRCYLGDDLLLELLKLEPGDDGLTSLARILGSAAKEEWEQHQADLLWDPEEAQRKAKEEDERKSREALQAKFAHVPEDPNKTPVEL
ncbi:hypothetical protein KIM372_15080 [Bombiscardovia nodaiensis]|uniref:Hydrolase n=1 Tax=Bombiscardovia nodaiensis TaxID=2932181 RepID=A0ABM8B9P7_9BIFI|nr:hypothetical protein KIM372_15080 [Bombiscardovia nodaiensis]